ncbi:MAG: class B sortase [Firmicutes bacterium]|nr:class B sortase [Mogibacterium sp.]MBR0456948.1 class B sortase [Bacillota bacterium]
MGKKTVIAVIMTIIGMAAVGIGAYQLWNIHWQDLKAETKFEEMSVTYGEGTSSEGVNQKLAALNAKNPDCIYWLKIPDTEIDYPVMYHPQEEEYYLYRDFDEEYSPSGSLYLAENCDPVFGDNLIVYGHHMRSGAMFAHLEDYKDEAFYKKHKYIELETLQGHEDYEIIAVFTTPVYTGHDFEYYKFTTTEDPKEFNNYVRQCKEKSIYTTGKTAEYGQRLLTLSTCEYSQKNGRMVIVAVRMSTTGSVIHIDAPENEVQGGASDGGDR